MAPKNIEDNQNNEGDIVDNEDLQIPLNDDDIVISGMAGKFPDSDDIYHFRDNLLNKADLVSNDDRRWKINHPEIPMRHGKINNIHDFDAGAFGFYQTHGSETDPMLRHLLERAFEAILDAGYNPSELAGTNTGVFIGAAFSEQEKHSIFSDTKPKAFPVVGHSRSMLAQRLSYCFRLTGPSYISDSACSSSMLAVEHAYRALKHGQCEKAIVGGASLCLRPLVTLQFARLGVLSMEGKCRSFDNAADGYVRADAICAIFLEKSKDSRRIYAHLVHAKSNCDGFKEHGITYPSSQVQKILMKEVYEECNVNPEEVVFVEGHGTGTVAGDLQELNSIDEVFCVNRKQPLYIGSVKANIGHTEPSSGLCSIIKILLGFECGYIPPNINFEKNREGAIGLENGRMKVITEKLPLVGTTGIAATNNFGFGGANVHVVLRWNQKVKRNDVLRDSIPRLVCVSGRTEEAIKKILDDLKENYLDAEFVKLLHTVFRKNIECHIYRGFSLVSKTGEIQRSINNLGIGNYKKLCLVFNNFDKKLLKIGSQLLALPPFANSIYRVQIALLKEVNIDILDANGCFIQENVISAILSNVAVQIGLADTLKELGIKPDGVLGIGIGDLIAAYYVDFLTLEETLLLTHYVILAISEKDKEKTIDYVNLSQELIQTLDVILKERKISPNWLPCHQSHDSIQGSVNYFSKNIINPISFDQVCRTISSESAVFVIGSKPNHQNIIFIKDDQKNYLNNFLICLGRLYENGFNMELDRLYPKIDFPLSRGTRMLSPLIKWDHSRAWKVYMFNSMELTQNGSYSVFISKKEDDWAFVAGHVIDGRNLFPATGYLRIVWETLAIYKEKFVDDVKVAFEDVKFMRAANVPNDGVLELVIHLHYQCDRFEITEGDTVIVTGKVYEATDDTNDLTALPLPDTNELEAVMNEKDIYKELKLRGYHYTDQFRSLKECNISGTKGVIQWAGNYVCFMDNMLQMEILQIDTKNLYVPTSIDLVIIDPKQHKTFSAEGNNGIDVYVNRESNIIRSGAIEIRGLKASAIPKKKTAEPVLETYKFIPNQAKLSTDEAIRVIMQIILENNPVVQVKSVELSNDGLNNSSPLLSPLIQKCLEDLPLIQQEIIVLSNIHVDLPGIVVKHRILFDESNCILVVGKKVLEQPQVLETALNCTNEKDGFILSRESLTFDAAKIRNKDISIFCVYENEKEKLVLFRKSTSCTAPAVVDMSDSWGTLNWLPALQSLVKKNDRVVVYAHNQDYNGILGFVNCLRREVNSSKISCFVLGDGAPQFDLNHPFYKNQLHKNIAINVWKDAKWGTYRHLLLDTFQSVETEHCYVNATVRGDLSTLKWIEGTLNSESKVDPERTLVQVYSAAINFRDVMMATGRIAADVVVKSRSEQECVLGLEFSGKDSSGNRVMGMVNNGGLSTLVMADSNFLWPMPDHWSMEDAATVPVVYGTVLYALLMRANAKRGQSILIHSGTGGVGQAAINVALYYGLTVFTTVGTKEKRNFIRQHFPEVPQSHIGNSRDCSFEQMVYNATKGRGVDIVLNSLAEEKLQASVRCVAKGGAFLEIGKFDLANNNALALQLFEKGVAFEGVMLDTLFSAPADAKRELGNCLVKAITDGAVKPLPRSIFKDDEIEQAFRFMTTGKHMGKVLIQVRKDAKAKEESVVRQIKAFPRFYANPEATYIILGGLGGFGLELTDYLVLRGARNLVLSSRTGISNGYQAFRIKHWTSVDANIIICTDDVTTKEGCTNIIKTASKLGPVEGIFNLAVVLEDGLFESQTIDKFKKSLAPKALTTKHIDVISRNLCPQLRYFVIFSSVSCGRGNAGQTNYGMANSVMERICERRSADGYPALAIQWGAIGDVGLVAQMQEDHKELVIGGTLQQKIASCLEVLDVFLKQREPIVASMVVAEKKSSTGMANTVMETVINIIGIHDIKTVSLHTSLPELGMDSMMAVEIKQILEREYEVLLTPQDIRTMTLARLKELSQAKTSDTETNESTSKKESTPDVLQEGFQLLIKNLGDESTANIPVIQVPNIVLTNKNTPKIFALPGIEGMASVLNSLTRNINGNVTCLQFCPRDCPDSITEMAGLLTKYMDLSNSNTFTLIAYSFGTLIATELVRKLEQRGYFGKVVFIDGAPELMLRMVKSYFKFGSDEELHISVICFLMMQYVSLNTVLEKKAELEKCKSFEERIQLAVSMMQNSQYSDEYVEDNVRAVYKRINAVFKYKPNFDKLKSELKLIKPTVESVRGIESDYKLTELFENVDVSVFEGDHATILENPDVFVEVNKFIHMEVELKQNGHRKIPVYE